MKNIILIILLLVVPLPSIGQSSVSENIKHHIKYLNKTPKKKQVDRLQASLLSTDTLESTLAISVLFKYFPDQYRTEMMDAFEIAYEDSRRATISHIYTEEETAQISTEIAEQFKNEYSLTQEEVSKIYLLYTFIEYRKRNVWTYKTERFAIPTTIAFRGGYLRGLLNDSMDYKQFISDMIERTKQNYEKKPKN